MVPDPDEVADIIRRVAADEILPRFGNLADRDIIEKKPGDPVTVADTAAEQAFERALRELNPESSVVGEEGADADRTRLRVLAGNEPVWIVDPIDGTKNFCDGNPRFSVIVAYHENGETRAGWIYEPVSESMLMAIAGGGAWNGPKRLRVAEPGPLDEMTGFLGSGPRKRLRLRHEAGESGIPRRLIRLGSVGCEYAGLALGDFHFARYAGRLKPWDHAAGVLIHREAGGYSAMLEDGADYDAAAGITLGGALALAPDRDSWLELRGLLAG